MSNNINFIGKITALISFAIGNTLFSLFLYFGESFISIKLGIGFVLLALIVNTLIFIVVFGSALLNKKYRIDAFKTCGFLLLNIPIAIAYLFIILSIEFPAKG